MKAEIIAVGTELLMGQVVNTNAAEIARMLAEIGVGVYHQTVVGDNAERLADAFVTAIDRVDLVIGCGGLGPTEDDLTRETLADVLGLPLREDEGWAQHLQTRFAQRRRDQPGHGDHPLPLNNLRQAMVPAGAELLPNSRGTAPGIYLETGSKTFALVPGPPGEMRTLMREQVLPRIAQRISSDGKDAVLVSRVLRVIGVGESRVAELLEPILVEQSNPTIAPLAHLGEMHLRITSHAPDNETAHALIETTAARIRTVLGDAVYGEDGDALEYVVGKLLAERGLTVALAESCTGGLICHRLTNVPGSSAYVVGGIVAYSDALKTAHLDVDPDMISREGAVSEPVALAMARGARAVYGSDIALAVTGIAGPGGGTDVKPVGLTYIALADHDGVLCRRYLISGDREEIKYRASQFALEMVRRRMLGR